MSDNQKHQPEVVIACDPKAVSQQDQEHWIKEIMPNLYGAVEEIRELPDGWAWRLPSTPEVLRLVAQDLNIERLCCPFVRYTLEIEPNHGPFWLRMTGGEGVKAFLRMSFESANYFSPQVIQAAGLNVVANPDMTSVEAIVDAVDKLNERYATSVQANNA